MQCSVCSPVSWWQTRGEYNCGPQLATQSQTSFSFNNKAQLALRKLVGIISNTSQDFNIRDTVEDDGIKP